MHIKQHYYRVRRDINPTGVVPAGPDLSGWLTPHGREELGGRPFGDGTPPHPPPPHPDEVVPAEHTAAAWADPDEVSRDTRSRAALRARVARGHGIGSAPPPARCTA